MAPPLEPSRARSSTAALVALVALAAVVRLPFWIESLRLPVDGDTAIVGLMARHGKLAATFWGQPYGSPLDAWVAAPFVTALGTTALAVRLPCFLLSLTLIPLAWALARRLHPAAAAPAAFLLACPPSYFLLLSALPPPVYPVALPLLGWLLLGALHLAGRSGWRAGTLLVLWGLLAGLALWTHFVALAVITPALAYLAWSVRRQPRGLAWLFLTVGPALLLTSAPWWLRLTWDPTATAVVSIGEDAHATWRHLRTLLPRLHEPVLGLLGAHTPTTADDPSNHVGLPPAGIVVLALLYALGVLRAAQVARRARRSSSASGARAAAAAALLGGAALLTLLAFPWPLRAAPETLRFLTPAYLPLAVLVAWGPAAEGHRRGAWVTTLTLALLHLLPASRLLAAWRASDGAHPLLPDCRPVLRLLDERGVRRAWASYDTAWCLTYLSGERVIASQPWNERFPGAPLRYRDEVRFARDAAWVLVPGADFALPRPEHFEERVRAAGGAFHRAPVGAALVYDRFVPPFPPLGQPLRGAGAAGDGNLATRVIEPGQGPTTLRLDLPAPLAAVTLAGGLEAPGLPRGLLLEASADGLTFERVARVRPGQAATEIVWGNGQPLARDDLEVVSFALGGRTVAALRVTPLGPQGPWSLAEVLLHPPAPAAGWPTDDSPEGTSWTERQRRVAADPHPHDARWLWRAWLTSRTRRHGPDPVVP